MVGREEVDRTVGGHGDQGRRRLLNFFVLDLAESGVDLLETSLSEFAAKGELRFAELMDLWLSHVQEVGL